jgi:plastocyanin
MTAQNRQITKGFRRPLVIIGGLLTGLLVLAAFELMVRPAFAVSAGDVNGADRTTGQPTAITDNTGRDAVPQKTAESTAKVGAKVSIANFAFTPGEITIAPGESVTWTNDDGAPHGLEYADGAPGTNLLLPGASFSRQFDQPGTYDYSCAVHPYMTGRVVVRAQ